MANLTIISSLLLALTACSAESQPPEVVDGGQNTSDAALPTEQFSVLFETTSGDFTIDVMRSWSPNGADRFAALVDSGFYDDCRFFRVVPGFMVQFGINGTPSTHAMWKNSPIPDDAVIESNVRGYVSFAQTADPNSRTTQLFINYGNNSFLDAMNFSPFGVIREGGMDAVDAINSEYGEDPSQTEITDVGTPYLEANFPNLDFIESASRVP